MVKPDRGWESQLEVNGLPDKKMISGWSGAGADEEEAETEKADNLMKLGC
jgi:hypothetical protein